ncbi:Do family serine endopeptidase [Lyticum sinuosum]|nr:Do family serine endopeptidase [Lyticum sinuosum]
MKKNFRKVSFLSLILHFFLFSTLQSDNLRIEKCFAEEILSSQQKISPQIDLADIVEKVMPAVVNISVVQKRHKIRDDQYNDELQEMLREFLERRFGVNPEDEGGPKRPNVLGSGFLIDPSGYIVTNNHVVDGAEEITVTLNNSGVMGYRAKLIGQDSKTDLALIKIESKENLPYLNFDDVSKLRVGDPVFAVGNPFGLGGTVTQGIISAKSRAINANGLGDDIQTDAAINRGNSGGPLCNSKTGKVLGVNSAIVTTTGGSLGIGFAVPASIARPVIEQLKTTGKVIRGWLGVRVQIVDDNIAKSIGLNKPIGGLVAEVIPDSPAEKSGIQVGDVITKMGDTEITIMSRLPRIVAEIPIGTKTYAEIFRGGKFIKLPIIIEKPNKKDPFSSDEEDESSIVSNDTNNILGVKVSNIDDETRYKYSIKNNATGVVISKVKPKSLASMFGIKVGDVIMRVNELTINNTESFNKALQEVEKSNKVFMMILLMRGNTKSFITIETNRVLDQNE